MELRPELRLLIATLDGGGSERVCLVLANQWAEEGRRVQLLLVRRTGAFLDRLHPEVRVTSAERPRVRDAAWWLVREINRHPEVPVLVFGFDLGVVLAPFRWAGVLRAPLVYREGSAPERNIPPSHHWLYRRALARLDAVVAQSDAARESLHRLGVRAVPIAVIANPVPASGPGVGAAVAPGPWAESRGPRLLAVGRLSPEKGHARLLEGFVHVRRRFPTASLRIVGEGALRQELEALARELRIEGAVTFLGFVAEPAALLAESDLFLLPSHYEGQPNALIEALLAGCRVLAAGGGGVRELLGAADLTGCFLDDSDFGEKLAQKVADALALPAARWSAAAAAWRALTAPERVARQYREFCQATDRRANGGCYGAGFAGQVATGEAPPRLILVINAMGAGGAEKQLLLTACGLAGRGMECHLFTLDGTEVSPRCRDLLEQARAAGVQWHPAAERSRFDLRQCDRVWRLLRGHRFPMLWTWGHRADLFRVLLGIRGPVPGVSILSLRSADEERIRKLRGFWRFMCRVADAVISNSRLNIRQLAAVVPGVEPKCHLVYNALDRAFAHAPLVELGARPSPLRLVMLGNVLIHIKGYDLAIQVLRRLKESGLAVTLTIAGRLHEGDRLRQLIAEHDVSDHVLLLDRVDNPLAHLRSGQLFLLCSRIEGTPNALLEALALGLPCVATDVGDLQELAAVFPGLQVVAREDVAGLTTAITRILDGWPAHVEQARRDAVRCREFFSEDRMSDETQTVLRRLVARGARAPAVEI